ncbi:MAG TPA: hypothetical protein VFS43_00295 [Polyangiaceae bacterium]|nr:hypothetical protein [Polyangiaceae bacterium]
MRRSLFALAASAARSAPFACSPPPPAPAPAFLLAQLGPKP